MRQSKKPFNTVISPKSEKALRTLLLNIYPHVIHSVGLQKIIEPSPVAMPHGLEGTIFYCDIGLYIFRCFIRNGVGRQRPDSIFAMAHHFLYAFYTFKF